MELELCSPFWFEPSRHKWLLTRAAAERRKTTLRRIATKRILVTGLARNCARRLPHHIRFVERLRTAFASSRVFVVENDSADETKAILKNWQISQLTNRE